MYLLPIHLKLGGMKLKRTIVTSLIIAALITGCNNTQAAQKHSRIFKVIYTQNAVDNHNNFEIVEDTQTHIEYIVVNGGYRNAPAITPRIALSPAKVVLYTK